MVGLLCAPGSWPGPCDPSRRHSETSVLASVLRVSATGAQTASARAGAGRAGVAVHGQCRGAHVGHALLVSLPADLVCPPRRLRGIRSRCSGEGSERGPLSVSRGFLYDIECVLLRNSWHFVIIMILVRAGVNIFKL